MEQFLAGLRAALVARTYRPLRNRHGAIPKGGGKVRVLGIPAIRDRVVHGARKLMREPIVEADCCDGSYGYRPQRSVQEAVNRGAPAIVQHKTRGSDVDVAAFVDTVRQDVRLGKVARRVQDGEILHVVKRRLKAAGKRGVPQGGGISPLLANVYLTEGDAMLERAKEETRTGRYTDLGDARYADDRVILVDGDRHHDWLLQAAHQRLHEELGKLHRRVNADKTRIVDLSQGASGGFLGCDFRRVRARRGAWRAQYTPELTQRPAVLHKLTAVCQRADSQPIRGVIAEIHPLLRGWVVYCRIGHARRGCAYVTRWVEKKVRRHMMRARNRGGVGWTRWSPAWLHEALGLFGDYRVQYRANA